VPAAPSLLDLPAVKRANNIQMPLLMLLMLLCGSSAGKLSTLEEGTPACTAPPVGGAPAMIVYGGSNTQGANAVNVSGGTVIYARPNPSFAHLLFAQLNWTKSTLSWGADGGAGPTLVGACASQFIPPTTRVGTVEFLPNMGFIKEDAAELGAIAKILDMLRSRGAAAFVVDVIAGSKRFEREGHFLPCNRFSKDQLNKNVLGCMSRERQLSLHNAIVALANATGAQLVSLDCDETPELFGADSFHLNAAGHRHVFNEIWRAYRQMPCSGQNSSTHAVGKIGDDSGVTCALGDELQPLIGSAVGFRRADLVGPHRVAKIGWEASDPGASIMFCVPLPRHAVAMKLASKRLFWHRKDADQQAAFLGAHFNVGIGFLVSHPHNKPLFGKAHVDCHGSCTCPCNGTTCIYDTLSNTSRVTVTSFLRLDVLDAHASAPDMHSSQCPPNACIVRVQNTNSADKRSRVVVRSIIAGVNDHRTAWLHGGQSLHGVAR